MHFPFHHTEYLKTWTDAFRFDKVLFIDPSREFLSEISLFIFNCQCTEVKNIYNNIMIWCNRLVLCKGAKWFYSSLLLHHQCKCQHSEKGKWLLSIITKTDMTLKSLWSTPRDSQRSADHTLKTSAESIYKADWPVVLLGLWEDTQRSTTYDDVEVLLTHRSQ